MRYLGFVSTSSEITSPDLFQTEKVVRELETDFFFRFQANLQMKAIQ